ncbi:hypothetical protein GCM10022243_55010 [Saccharothrix violaceirubra]|uniref:Uncharacterized protein n=1 Tax=Saccharothrix violaceirubra TaxID=413306 RepID=A0A7W7T5L2_9PSEU|nr:hypothetical protein [Saccharothrix violaceirubra]MBB4967014.1 hypothetical protein [Saccharothrix violaceirubra]
MTTTVTDTHSPTLHVPYITAWSAEQTEPHDLVALPGNTGIGYRDERAQDRDRDGVLWRRVPLARNQGKPLFGVVHSPRQRRAMRKLLCQVCAHPADTDPDGTLFALPDNRTDWADWPEGMACTEPPVCADCLTLSTRLCPALRRGHAVVRVRNAPIVGVHGALHVASPNGVRGWKPTIATFDDPALSWVLASHLVRELRDVTRQR